jgi:hypothetical protein
MAVVVLAVVVERKVVSAATWHLDPVRTLNGTDLAHTPDKTQHPVLLLSLLPTIFTLTQGKAISAMEVLSLAIPVACRVPQAV